ncbi:MAG TPA: NADH-quinone oxidoreductase subunit J [Chloroflexia bacterium]|nr:NADH-quinone oxidoreductase subunit J [Chloroflexia bacterium]
MGDISIGDVKIPLPPLGQLVFLPAAGLAIISGIMMITRRNAVHSALWLIMAFFNLAVMYVMLGAEFLAALQVLVYTGAILVLFLFVIMLLGLKEGPKLGGVHAAQLVAAWPVGVILMVQLLLIILFSSQPRSVHIGDIIGNQQVVWNNELVLAQGGNVQVLGQTLYTQFLLPFEIASLVLLLAIVGAIVLSRKEEPAEVEEILPALGISLGRRSLSRSSQEDQVEKKLLPALGVTYAPDATVKEYEQPTVDQPDAIGAGTTAGVELPKEK